jgi:hypothetical protein
MHENRWETVLHGPGLTTLINKSKSDGIRVSHLEIKHILAMSIGDMSTFRQDNENLDPPNSVL